MVTYKTQIPAFTIKRNKTEIPKAKINSSTHAAEYARQFYFEDIEVYESFFLMMLNRANNTIGFAKISQGGISGTVVDVRILAKLALDALATSIILVHNHPSGNMQPSTADKVLTEKITKALKLLDVKVLDHIILSPVKDVYFSFGDEGLI